jgi:hypothetical protein
MKQEPDAVRTELTFEIFFPKSPEDTKTKEDAYSKLLELIERSEKAENVKLTSDKNKKTITLDSDELHVHIRYIKKLSVLVELVRPETNIESANDAMNSVLNYINSVLGVNAKESKAVSSKIVCKEKLSDLKRVIGEEKLAEINQRAKRVLKPFGIMFEYKLPHRRYILGIYSDRPAEVIYSYRDYNEPIPFNFISTEYKAFKHPEKIIEKLYQEGLQR